MTAARRTSLVLLVIAIVAGWFGDRVAPAVHLALGGYEVIAADFHTHSATWSDGALTPWGLVLEARRQGLDAIAVTGHNQVSDANVAAWFASAFGGPLVIVGQEILGPRHHVIAIGIDHAVDSRLPVAAEIDEVHRQGGVAIAAHPRPLFWPAFDQAAMTRLDGAEICHPVVYGHPEIQRELEAFAARGRPAAIGSSDFHGLGRMVECRTFVFALDRTVPAILDAIRARRTVVYSDDGRVYGDPELIRLAAKVPRLRASAVLDAPAPPLDLISRVTGTLGLLGLILTVPGTKGRALSRERR